MCYLKEARPLTGAGKPMNCTVKRAALSCRVFAFAIRLPAVANLANATAPDLSFASATLHANYQAGAASPAAQPWQINNTPTAFDFSPPLL